MKRVIITFTAIASLATTVFVACDTNDDPLPVKGGRTAVAGNTTSGSGQSAVAGATTSDVVATSQVTNPDGTTEVVGQPYGIPAGAGTTTSGGQNATTAGGATTSSTGSTTGCGCAWCRIVFFTAGHKYS